MVLGGLKATSTYNQQLNSPTKIAKKPYLRIFATGPNGLAIELSGSRLAQMRQLLSKSPWPTGSGVNHYQIKMYLVVSKNLDQVAGNSPNGPSGHQLQWPQV